jgi:hypothetical protein
MPTKLRPRAAATRVQPAARETRADGQHADAQAGMPQERVNENKMTMKSTIAGTPNAM